MNSAGHVARLEKKGNAYIILVVKLVGKRLLGRSSHRCENNSSMNVKMGWDDVVQGLSGCGYEQVAGSF